MHWPAPPQRPQAYRVPPPGQRQYVVRRSANHLRALLRPPRGAGQPRGRTG
jgi:hypothetical protein